MADARFKSNRPAFNRKHEAMMDMILGRMTRDIEVGIKTSAGTPVKTGDMKGETRHHRTANNRWRVESGKEYSAYQERGMRKDGTHKVRNYTTAGTSAGWFRRAINGVIRNRRHYIMEARRAFNL